jgi:3',5'-cyclic AMP phosphodiesterase CpdA
MPRLAHISDIHFGKTFNVAVWNNVKQTLLGFKPTIIIASGDFTDSPDPLLLLAAKFELEDLCAGCGPNTQFFVVPGNHDVLDWGNIWHPGAASRFERIMFNDTSQVRSDLELGLGSKFGLNEKTLSWSRRPKISRLIPKSWFWSKTCDGRLQSCDYRRGGSLWPSKSIHDQTLIACFNSNSWFLREFIFATGKVEGDQITRISSEIPNAVCPCCGPRQGIQPALAANGILLRVAVLHHHPLPIAVRNKSLNNQIVEAKLEPFLILKNGGDLILELQRQQFDLVLHGHKHRPQFARVELRADDPEDYPLLVLAGGSTAKSDEDSSDNTLRYIKTEQNGRLEIRTFAEGKLQKDRIYRESLQVLKRRTFIGATEHAKISAQELYSEAFIDGVGHLRGVDRTTGLRVRSKGETRDGMVINVTLPPHGKRLYIDLEDCRDRDRVTLCWRDSAGASHDLNDPNLPPDGYCWLGITNPLDTDSQPLTFGVREVAANSIAMSRWELTERSRHNKGSVDPIFEQVGFNITYPVEKIVLRLHFPPELDGVTPEVRCSRHPKSPNFPLRFLPDQRPSGADPAYQPDTDLTEEESKGLKYDPSHPPCWILEIDRPLAGNRYSLRWRVPDLKARDIAVQNTRAIQRLLLSLDGTQKSAAIRQKCHDLFVKFAALLMERFRSELDPLGEKQTAFLMVYNENDLMLHPVLSHSNAPVPVGSFDLPLGEGVAGAAFLGRRIVTWQNDPGSGSLIKPPSDTLNSRWILALPIYYQARNAAGELELETLPGALIGVITLGSDEISSRISDCYPEDRKAQEIGQEAQKIAQKCVFDMLPIFARGAPGP